jgi:NitT/TauT family transport system substrate-binding protein
MILTRARATLPFTLSVIAILSAIGVTVALVATIFLLFPAFTQQQPEQQNTLRIGYFPNVNHAQAVIGVGNGDFQRALGDNVKLKSIIFNAGPSAIESLLANRIDVAYIGPNPAINGYVVSDGKNVRVIAAASNAGASFVVRNDSKINSVHDLGGKKFASPQLGGTQDVALRTYLQNNGYKTSQKGGNVTVVSIANPDILTLFLKNEIDGAWVPEHWATRLLKEANGMIFVDERDLWSPEGKFVTANIIVRHEYMKENPDVIKKLLSAHVNETLWINNNKEEAIKEFNVQLKKLAGHSLPEDVLLEALTRLEFTYDPMTKSLFQSANDAYDLGFLSRGEVKPILLGIYDLTLLDEVLSEIGLPSVNGIVEVRSNASSYGTEV